MKGIRDIKKPTRHCDDKMRGLIPSLTIVATIFQFRGFLLSLLH